MMNKSDELSAPKAARIDLDIQLSDETMNSREIGDVEMDQILGEELQQSNSSSKSSVSFPPFPNHFICFLINYSVIHFFIWK